MAEPLATLLSFPPDKKRPSPKEYDDKITSYLKELRKLNPNVYTKPVEKQSILELLDPTTNAIAYLFALLHQIEAAGKDAERLEQLAPLAFVYLTSCDPVQIRYVGEHWQSLFDWVYKVLESGTSAGVVPLVTALLHLDPSAGTFTTNHLKIMRLALSIGVPSQTLPIIDRDIYAYPQKTGKSDPTELLSEDHELSNAYITDKSGFTLKLQSEYVLEYYLLGAYVYIGQRNWSRARLFLEYVLLAPTQQHATSLFHVEAYKKWTLIGLLSEGKLFPLPRTADAAMIKNIRSLSKAYEALAEDFEKRDLKKFHAEAEAAGSMWQDDGNARLVKEAGEALMRYRVIDLQKTYAALPVARVATLIGTPANETLSILTNMVRSGHLHASISSAGKDAVLRFHSTTAIPLSTSSTEADLEAQTKRITHLVTFVRDADRRLQLTKEYVEHIKRSKRTGGPDGDLADMMDLTWDGPIQHGTLDEDGDEDIMA